MIPELKRFSGIYLADGQVRRMTFEAVDLEDARQQASRWGVGVEGEVPEGGPVKQVPPELFNLKDTQRMLGGISRAAVYQLLTLGELERQRDTRRLLITRRSIERWVGARK